jgi:hypothetical protein
MSEDGSWAVFTQALPHTLRVCSALEVPGAPGRAEAYRDAMALVSDQGDEGPVLLAWTRIAGLPGIPGAEVLAAELQAPDPGPLAPRLAALVDAGITGDLDQMLAAMTAALTDLGDDGPWTMAWPLARVMSGVMGRAGGVRGFARVARQHWKAFSPRDALPGEAAVIEPASLAVAAVAAGNAEYGREVLAWHYGHDPRVVPALLHIWLKLAALLLRGEPAGSGLRMLQLDQQGLPDAFVDTPADNAEAVADVARDIITVTAANDHGKAAAAFGRLAGLSPDDQVTMTWVLARSLGLHFSRARQDRDR